MKTRSGFVSNSSSSSFIIFKFLLPQHIIDEMENDIGGVVKKLMQVADYEYDDKWEKPPTYNWEFQSWDNIFSFETTMDNFDMHYIFENAGFPTKHLGHHYGWELEEENKRAGETLKLFLGKEDEN